MTTSLAVRTRARVSGGLLCIAVSCLTPPRASAQTAEAVRWTNLVNAAASGNSIQKVGTCGGCSDAGGTSGEAIAEGDGYVEFTPSRPSTLRGTRHHALWNARMWRSSTTRSASGPTADGTSARTATT